MWLEVGENDYVFIPGKGVFTIKPPDILKARGVACGNHAADTAVDLFASGVEAITHRLCLALAVQQDWDIFSTDVGAAFLYADLKLPYAVIVQAPQVFVEAGICHEGVLWLVKKATYGLRESPRAWSDHRDMYLRYLQVVYKKMLYRLVQSKTDPAVWMLSKRPSSLLVKSKVGFAWPKQVRVLIYQFVGDETAGLLITYVDDLLMMAETNLASHVIELVRDKWKCTAPSILSRDGSLTFCSTRITKVAGG